MRRASLVLLPFAACLGATFGSSVAGATEARAGYGGADDPTAHVTGAPGDPATENDLATENDPATESDTADAPPPSGEGVVLQAVTCERWSDVPANATQGMEEDDTDGRYEQWGPFDPQRVQPLAVQQLAACAPLDGVAFRLSGTEYGNGLKEITDSEGRPVYSPDATTLSARQTGDDGPGTLEVPASELTLPQRSALTDGRGLWVQATGFSGQFANLRCHEDRYNADNLEVIRLMAGTPGPGAACVLYVIGAVAQVPPPPPVITTPPVVTMPPVVTVPPLVPSPSVPPSPAVVAPTASEEPVAAPSPTSAPPPAVDIDADPPAAAVSPLPPSAVVLVPGQPLVEDTTTGDPFADRGAQDGSAIAAPDLADRPPSPTSPVPVDLSPVATVPVLALETPTSAPQDEQDGEGREGAVVAITVTTDPELIEQPVEGSEEALAAVGRTGGAAGGLDPVAAATLGAVFLAGLGLTVLAARRPL